MPYKLYFDKESPSSFQIFNGDIPTLDILGGEAEILIFEGDEVFLKIPIHYQYKDDNELGFWGTKEPFVIPQRVCNQKRSKTKMVEVPELHFFPYLLKRLATKDSITLQDLLEASVETLFVVSEENYPNPGYYRHYLNNLDKNEAWDWMGIPPNPTPENVGPYICVHFLDGDTDKVAIIDTLRIWTLQEELWGMLQSAHVHEERRDYP